MLGTMVLLRVLFLLQLQLLLTLLLEQTEMVVQELIKLLLL